MKKEIITGVNGSGNKVWHVVTEWIDTNGRNKVHFETFDNETEALHWMKWA
ncbi:MAG: hypothetical protein ACYSUV_20645 [Planctomycetota bacterium]